MTPRPSRPARALAGPPGSASSGTRELNRSLRGRCKRVIGFRPPLLSRDLSSAAWGRGTIAFDGERSCDLVDAGDRFGRSPRQTRAIAWATLRSPGSGHVRAPADDRNRPKRRSFGRAPALATERQPADASAACWSSSQAGTRRTEGRWLRTEGGGGLAVVVLKEAPSADPPPSQRASHAQSIHR